MENVQVQERGAQLTSIMRQASAPLCCPLRTGMVRRSPPSPCAPELNELSSILNRGYAFGSPPSCVLGYGCSPPARSTNPMIMDVKFCQRQGSFVQSGTTRKGISGLCQAMSEMSTEHISDPVRHQRFGPINSKAACL